MKVLAVGAHPDDVELGCGAALLAHRGRGDSVGLLVLTSGEHGPQGQSSRVSEQEIAASILGAELFWGGFEDGTVPEGRACVTVVEEAIRATGADVVYTHSPRDSHQDHRSAAVATLAAGRHVGRILMYETPSSHLAPTALAARFLASEGVDGARIQVVGNTVVDVVRESGVARVPVESRAGVLVTAHRASTVDSPERLRTLVELLVRVAGLADSDPAFGPVVFPAHPRTRDRLSAAGLLGALMDAGIQVVAPLPYREMLTALAAARVVVTDSGGLQEEAAWFGVPVVVLRRSTPRWEGVAAGSSELVGLDGDAALAAVARFGLLTESKRVDALECPYGDGFTSARAVDAIAEAAAAGLLRFGEPDFVGRAVPGSEGRGGEVSWM